MSQRRRVSQTAALLMALGWFAPSAQAEDKLEIELGVEGRVFAEEGAPDSPRSQFNPRLRLSAGAAPEESRWFWQLDVVGHLDTEDSRRSSIDAREAYVGYLGDTVEVTLGARRVFWGVTEFVHLVDVLNPSDLALDVDDEVRLGQPMLRVDLPLADGLAAQFYAVAGHRPRRLPGRDGRLHGGLSARGDESLGSTARGESPGLAARLEWRGGDIDVGVAHYSGVTREPRFVPTADGRPRPHYEHIEQTSIDALWQRGDWAYKLELLRRTGQGAPFVAAALGFERTLVGAIGRADLGLVVEWLYDERNAAAPLGRFEHDLALGLRVAPNDSADSQLLLGLIHDLHDDEHVYSLELSTRLHERLALRVEARVFGGHVQGPTVDAVTLNAFRDPANKTGFLDADDYLSVELTTFF